MKNLKKYYAIQSRADGSWVNFGLGDHARKTDSPELINKLSTILKHWTYLTSKNDEEYDIREIVVEFKTLDKNEAHHAIHRSFSTLVKKITEIYSGDQTKLREMLVIADGAHNHFLLGNSMRYIIFVIDHDCKSVIEDQEFVKIVKYHGAYFVDSDCDIVVLKLIQELNIEAVYDIQDNKFLGC